MKLSACIIARNEQATIRRCLKSLKGIDEIIVVDTGSTDRTVEIAQTFSQVKVFYAKWNDDFAEARNKTLDYATGDWVLSIDCDEILDAKIDEVKQVIADNPAANCLTVTLHTPHSDFLAPRLLRRAGLFWTRPIHETPSHRPTKNDRIMIHHLPAGDHHGERNIRILRSLLSNKHMDTDAMFYLGEELHNKGDYDASVFWLSQYVEMSPKHKSYTSWAYYLMAKCYWELYRRQKAEDCLMRAIGANPEFKRAYEMLYDVTRCDKWLTLSKNATNEDVLVW